MNCLCCGKSLPGSSSATWHKACIRRFFGTEVIPDIDISDRALEIIVSENVSRGYTVPGVQKKLSLNLMSEGNPRLTLVNYPTGYILKPQVKEFPCLPEAEHLVMNMADACGIATVPHALIRMGDELAYITKRIDRIIEPNAPVKLLAMEDFCQLDLRLTQDKYRGSYERCAKIIRRYSMRTGLDLSELFIRLVFCFLTGNSDMHLKNFSLIETSEGSAEYVLSPAYDLLPVNVIMPEDTEEFALTINGKKRNIQRKDFLVFADSFGLGGKPAEKMIKKLLSMQARFANMIGKSLLPDKLKDDFKTLLNARADILR
ncbi:MAG: HipA domain-containing protein [Saccharofermentanales bacterium]|jgi:serine/threonine-protein kinase HipA